MNERSFSGHPAELLQQTTRSYAHDGDGFLGTRQAVTAVSAAHPLPQLGRTREVRVLSSTRCWLNFGDADVQAAQNGTSLPIAVDSGEVLPVPEGATHFAVLQDGAGGSITLTPVA